MNSIEQLASSITDDRRATYLFDTKAASDAVGCHPNKFNDWWQRTNSKLLELYISQPGQLAAEIAALFARAEAERSRREERRRAGKPPDSQRH